MSCGYFPSCGPSCAVPSCLPACGSPCGYPGSGLGSLGSCGGYYGGATSASSLGLTSGGNIGCVTQLPPSEMVIQPAPCCVTIPGAVLSASCEPVRVAGYTACGGGSTLGGGRFGGSICGYPC
ncbi:late cornified envelope protein 1D [Heteronotia binoei]|uniref:late cornified envelope protein 1D n=1 Tax=Heteronotia binoei TaxID=13085 RepID=UPI00292F164A|nr:late cornified envelope protein 1D [Heteronotia binoei]